MSSQIWIWFMRGEILVLKDFVNFQQATTFAQSFWNSKTKYLGQIKENFVNIWEVWCNLSEIHS